jgi:hypothetical protein
LDAIFAAIPEKEFAKSQAELGKSTADAEDKEGTTTNGDDDGDAGSGEKTKTDGRKSVRSRAGGDGGGQGDGVAGGDANGVAASRGSEGKRTAKASEANTNAANAAKGGAKPPLPKPDYTVSCPRCKSDDTKFCYYNNYNIKQPRFYCKGCCRYWTEGGMLRNVRVGAGKRKNKKVADRWAAAATLGGVNDAAGGSVATKLGGKRPRAGSDAGAKKSKSRTKRDGSSDGSATEAEQRGQNRRVIDNTWNGANGSNTASETALRDRSPEEQGSAEGGPVNGSGPNVHYSQGMGAAGWGMDPAVAQYIGSNMLQSAGEGSQARAAAAAAASAAIMSAATRWGMQFWNKSAFPPFASNTAMAGNPNSVHPQKTAVSEAALKSDGLSHPTPLHPMAAAQASSQQNTHGAQQNAAVAQYSSLFQNPWGQFVQDKGFSNPAAFQAMQQQMFNQQMAAHLMQMQQFGAMGGAFGYGIPHVASINQASGPAPPPSSAVNVKTEVKDEQAKETTHKKP